MPRSASVSIISRSGDQLIISAKEMSRLRPETVSALMTDLLTPAPKATTTRTYKRRQTSLLDSVKKDSDV